MARRFICMMRFVAFSPGSGEFRAVEQSTTSQMKATALSAQVVTAIVLAPYWRSRLHALRIAAVLPEGDGHIVGGQNVWKSMPVSGLVEIQDSLYGNGNDRSHHRESSSAFPSTRDVRPPFPST